MAHKKVFIPLKSFKEARIVMQHRKFIFCLWINVLRKNNSENLTIFRGEFKTENFKKIRKIEVF